MITENTSYNSPVLPNEQQKEKIWLNSILSLNCFVTRSLRPSAVPKHMVRRSLLRVSFPPHIQFLDNCSCQAGLGPVSPGQPFPRLNQLQGSQQSPSTEHDLQPVSSFCSGIFLGVSCSYLSSNASTDGNGWTSQTFLHVVRPSDKAAHKNMPDESGSVITLSDVPLK